MILLLQATEADGDLNMIASAISLVAAILSIIAAVFSIIVLWKGKKVIDEYIIKKEIDAYNGFYKILKRLLNWLEKSLTDGTHYALAEFAPDDSTSSSSFRDPKLLNQYEECRKRILDLLCTNENQMQFVDHVEYKKFENELDKLVNDYLLRYYRDVPNKDLLKSQDEMKEETKKIQQIIKDLVKSIKENGPSNESGSSQESSDPSGKTLAEGESA